MSSIYDKEDSQATLLARSGQQRAAGEHQVSHSDIQTPVLPV